MPVGLSNIGTIIRAGLEFQARIAAGDPAALAEQEEGRRVLAAKAAAERAHYDALSPEERREYDALTLGMMPRLAR
jgi:hypothetical protein